MAQTPKSKPAHSAADLRVVSTSVFCQPNQISLDKDPALKVAFIFNSFSFLSYHWIPITDRKLATIQIKHQSEFTWLQRKTFLCRKVNYAAVFPPVNVKII